MGNDLPNAHSKNTNFDRNYEPINLNEDQGIPHTFPGPQRINKCPFVWDKLYKINQKNTEKEEEEESFKNK